MKRSEKATFVRQARAELKELEQTHPVLAVARQARCLVEKLQAVAARPVNLRPEYGQYIKVAADDEQVGKRNDELENSRHASAWDLQREYIANGLRELKEKLAGLEREHEAARFGRLLDALKDAGFHKDTEALQKTLNDARTATAPSTTRPAETPRAPAGRPAAGQPKPSDAGARASGAPVTTPAAATPVVVSAQPARAEDEQRGRVGLAVIVDHWQEDGSYTVAVGTSPADVTFAKVPEGELAAHPAVLSPDDLFVFDSETKDVMSKLGGQRLPAEVNRLHAIARCFAIGRAEDAVVLSIGIRGAEVGVVSGDRVVKQQSVPDLALTAIWERFLAGREELVGYLAAFLDRKREVFDDFAAALHGSFRTDGHVPFVSPPDLGFLRPRLSDALAAIDPQSRCRTLILGDWAAVNSIATLALDANPRVRIPREGETILKEACLGFFSMQEEVRTIAGVVDALKRELGRVAGTPLAGQIARVNQMGTGLTQHLGDADAYCELLAAIDGLGMANPPAAYWDLLRLSKFVRITRDPDAVLAMNARDHEELDIHGGPLAEEMKVSSTLAPGYRLPGGGRVLKKASVAIHRTGPAPPTETEGERLVRETREALGAEVASFDGFLQSVHELPDPRPAVGLLDRLGADKARPDLLALRGRWMDLLDIEEFPVKGESIQLKDVDLAEPLRPNEKVVQITGLVRPGLRRRNHGAVVCRPVVKVKTAKAATETPRRPVPVKLPPERATRHPRPKLQLALVVVGLAILAGAAYLAIGWFNRTPPGRVETVARAGVNVREQHNRFAAVSWAVPVGSQLIVIDSAYEDGERWCRVREHRRTGWVHFEAFTKPGEFRKVQADLAVVTNAGTGVELATKHRNDSLEVTDDAGDTVRVNLGEGRRGVVQRSVFGP
ncbi:MAG: hypothetical protein NTX53_20055 [candidate division WOR-3 bacterium]|nr:hypothetical protein [candidate division WOR-3 bacterium]